MRALLAGGRPVVFCIWHQRIMCCEAAVRRYRLTFMVSQSRDGERIARVVARLGYRTTRGSSSSGGVRALLGLVREVRGGAIGAHVVDGPRGPARVVKAGTLTLAQRSHAVIVPLLATARHRFEFGSWDRMLLPLPFTRTIVRFGEPLEVPEELAPDAFEALRLELEQSLEHGARDLDFRVGG